MERLIKWLPEKTAALIISPENRHYLTGFTSSLGYLFVTHDGASLIVDGRYYVAAKSAAHSCKVLLLEKLSEQLRLLVNQNDIKTVHIEDTVSVSVYDSIKCMLDGTAVAADKSLTGFLSELRSVKNDVEAENIIHAQRIAEHAFDDLLTVIKPGVTERDLAAELDYKMKKYGSEKESFETIAVSGAKSAMPHGVPDGKMVISGEFITFDFGAVYNGYHSDMTRTVAVGRVSDKMMSVYDTVLKANLAAEKAVREGIPCCDVDKAARTVITDAGYGAFFTHSTGHSVGLEIHESLNISPKNDTLLKAGNVITDEPGIYIENEFGVRIEDMLLVTKDGCLNLAKTTKQLIIL